MGISTNAPEGAVRTAGNFAVVAAPVGGIESYTGVKATELNAATFVDVTYSMPPDGFNYTPGYTELNDDRLTFPTARVAKGPRTDTFTVTIVHGAEDETAAEVFVEGASLDVVERRVTPHDTDFAAGQKVKIHPVDVIEVEDGAPNDERFTQVVTFSYRQERVRATVAA